MKALCVDAALPYIGFEDLQPSPMVIADSMPVMSLPQSQAETRPSLTNNDGKSSLEQSTGSVNYVPRPKRIACIICRRRKLKCDSQRPSCGNCSRLGHACAYDEVRKKSGPKRGYVKQLEARLGMRSTA